MDDFQRCIISIFVDLQGSSPGEFTRYNKAVDLIQTNFHKAKLSITTEQIDDGYLEGMGTSYRLRAMGKVCWENHSLLEEVNRLTTRDWNLL